MKTLYDVVIVSVLLLHAGLSWSTGQQSKLETYLGSSSSFTANFTQQTFNATDELIEESSGAMSFSRPGKFRWIYEKPFEQIIISDNKTLWIYDKDLEQVSIRPINEGLNKTPIMLLDDPANISQEFEIKSLSDLDAEAMFLLTPKHEEAGFQSVILIFHNDKLVGMRINDNFDQTSHLSFQDIQHNVQLADEVFHFEPPEGVDVIRAAEQPY